MLSSLFVRTLVKRLAGKTTLVISYCVEGFPVQRSDWRVTYCNGFILRIPNTYHFHLPRFFQFFNCNIFFDGTV